jgi:hypothetical protein
MMTAFMTVAFFHNAERLPALQLQRQPKKRAAWTAAQELTGRRQTEWTSHSNPEDWMGFMVDVNG